MNKSNFSIIYFLFIFFILYYGFYIYVGLTTPDGRLYSSFLYSYLNIPYWLSIVVAKGSQLLLKVTGYDVYQKNPVNITIRGSHGATIAWGCVGVGVMVVWLAFIAAHKARIKYKFMWIGSGIVLIFVFNIIRISFIILSYYYHWAYFQSFNAHTTFNYTTYFIIIILMIIFVLHYNKMKKKEYDLA
jgi:exosortase/archaeosortase family protein